MLHWQDLKNTNVVQVVKSPLFLRAHKSIRATYSHDQKHTSGNQTQAPIVTTYTNTMNHLTRMKFAYHFLTGVTVLVSSMSGRCVFWSCDMHI